MTDPIIDLQFIKDQTAALTHKISSRFREDVNDETLARIKLDFTSDLPGHIKDASLENEFSARFDDKIVAKFSPQEAKQVALYMALADEKGIKLEMPVRKRDADGNAVFEFTAVGAEANDPKAVNTKMKGLQAQLTDEAKQLSKMNDSDLAAFQQKANQYYDQIIPAPKQQTVQKNTPAQTNTADASANTVAKNTTVTSAENTQPLNENTKKAAKQAVGGVLVTGAGVTTGIGSAGDVNLNVANAEAIKNANTFNMNDFTDPNRVHLKKDSYSIVSKPIVTDDKDANFDMKVNEYKIAGNGKYDGIAYLTFAMNAPDGGARDWVDLLPVADTKTVNLKSTIHYDVDKSAVTEKDKDEIKSTAQLIVDAIKSGQKDVSIEIEGHASFTGTKDPVAKKKHNQELSDSRGVSAYAEIKKQALALGVTEQEFDEKVKITKQQSFGETNLINNTTQESSENRVAIVRVNNLVVPKNNYHDIIISVENLNSIRLNNQAGGSLTFNFPEEVKTQDGKGIKPVNEQTIAATMHFENVGLLETLYGGSIVKRPTPHINLRGLKDVNNVKMVFDVDDLPQKGGITTSASAGHIRVDLDQTDAQGKGSFTPIVEFPVLDKHGNYGTLKNGQPIENVYIKSKGREYQNINGMPIEQVIELRKKQEAPKIVADADVNHDGVIAGQELVDLKKKYNNTAYNTTWEGDVLAYVQNLKDQFDIKYDDKHHVTEIKLHVSPDVASSGTAKPRTL